MYIELSLPCRDRISSRDLTRSRNSRRIFCAARSTKFQSSRTSRIIVYDRIKRQSASCSRSNFPRECAPSHVNQAVFEQNYSFRIYNKYYSNSRNKKNLVHKEINREEK